MIEKKLDEEEIKNNDKEVKFDKLRSILGYSDDEEDGYC